MSWFVKLCSPLIMALGKLHWKSTKVLSQEQQAEIQKLLVKNYLIILTRRRNHLSTLFINFADFIMTGKWGYWTHSLMNLEDEVATNEDFRLIEATSVGVHYSTFDQVFNVQDVVLLKPKTIELTAWTTLMDTAKLQLGKPYDTLFNITDDKALSCVELVRLVLSSEPNYHQNFAKFEALITKSKNLSPQMLFDCQDFDIVYLAKV